MPEFRNLPGIIVQKDDGNLLVTQSIPGDVTLVLGSSPDGPINRMFQVVDTYTADATFDPSNLKNGSLLKGMYEVLQSGAKYAALYRLGGSPEIIDHLNGWTIHAKDTKADKFKLNYQFSGGSHILRIYDAETNELVYNNLTGLDSGALTVYFTETMDPAATITIGEQDAGVLLSQVNQDIGSALGLSFALGDDFLTLDSESTLVKAGGLLTIAGSSDPSDDGDYIISYVLGTKVVLSHKKVAGSFVAFAGFAAASGGGSVTGQVKVKYMAPQSGVGLSYMEKFEELAKAYWELESSKVDMVIPMDVYFDAPNLFTNTGTKEVPAESDYLGAVYQFEHNGELFFMWDTDGDGIAEIMPSPYALGIDGLQAQKLLTGTYTIETILNDASNPASDITFSEANFGHQLAEFCHNLSVNDNECAGVISMRPPANFSKSALIAWLGKEPKFDASGLMIANGTGLLGYKYMAGVIESTVNNGLYDTDSQFVDGSVSLDRNNQPIDIGRYISVVASPLIIKSGYVGGATGLVGNAASIYAGLDMSLPANESAMNKLIKARVALPFALKKTYLDKLVAAKYIAFTSTPDNKVKVIDTPTAAQASSDYNRRLNVKISSAVVEIVRAITDPFIGKIINGEIRNAIEEQVNSALNTLQKPGIAYLIAGQAEVRATRDMEIKGEATLRLTLFLPGELRKLTIYLSLSK